MASSVVSLCMLLAAPFAAGETIKEDFSKPALKDWKASTEAWKVQAGELHAAGGGYLELTKPLSGDFTLAFDARTDEKANIEVKVLDKTGKKTLYTFAFLGRYHPVLDGPKSSILKGDRFVSVGSRMWIFPGRVFAFEVRRVKGQLQMFLNKELGPTFVDAEPPPEVDEFRVRIELDPEGKKDGARFDNVVLTRE